MRLDRSSAPSHHEQVARPSRYDEPPGGWPPDDDLSADAIGEMARRLKEVEEGGGGPFVTHKRARDKRGPGSRT